MTDHKRIIAEDNRQGSRQAAPKAPGEGGPYHILAAASLADEQTRVLKHGDTFAVFDHYGDIKPGGLGEQGLYHHGTRHLSGLLLELEGGRPFFLSSTVRDENDQLAVALTNPDLLRDGRVWALLGTLHIALKKFLWQGVCYQELKVRNHGMEPVAVTLTLHFAADFADIFEVRGMKRKARGEDLPTEVTGDQAFIKSIWPNVEAALQWIDQYGDRDGDGFVEYRRQSSDGLIHQGWRDADDAVFHADGSPAEGSIALCEVQAYVYGALRAAATLATALSRTDQAVKLMHQAEKLRERFEAAFWCEELSTYALALDGDKQPCRVRTSNAGQCLFTGIASEERARRLARTLLGAESFSGWGIRTVAASEVRYNPMSYHNGSVWPHDNALIAQGLARYGLGEMALQIWTGLFQAGLYFDWHRMPELFCGFPQEPGEGPIHYPVACAPQAWSAASVFLLFQACLGLEINGPDARIYFTQPRLPASLGELRIHNLEVMGTSVDLLLVRHEHDVGVNVLRREGDVQILVAK